MLSNAMMCLMDNFNTLVGGNNLLYGLFNSIISWNVKLLFVGLVDHAEGSPPYWACGVVGFRRVHPGELPLSLGGLVWFCGQ